MASYNIGKYYEAGRRQFAGYAKKKRAYESAEAEKKRSSESSEAALKRGGEMERAKLQYGPDSPAMIGAKTGAGVLGLRREEFGFERGFKPWQTAMEYDLARRGLQRQGIVHGEVPLYQRDEKGNIVINETTGQPIKTGESPYVLAPGPSGGYYDVSPGRPGIPQAQQPTYAEPNGIARPIPQPIVPQYPYPQTTGTPAPGVMINPAPQGYGTMRVEGQPGYYGVNMPAEQGGTPISTAYPTIRRYGGTPPQKKKPVQGKEDWKRYLPK